MSATTTAMPSAAAAAPVPVGAITPAGSTATPPGGDDKFWDDLARIAIDVIPRVYDALRKGDFDLQKDFQEVPGGQESGARSLTSSVRSARSCSIS